MLGEPVTDIAKPIDMSRQIDAVAQRRGGFGACGDDGEVENGKRDHGAKLVRQTAATKAPGVQIRPAHAGTQQPAGVHMNGTMDSNIHILVILPTDISRAVQDL